MKTILISLLVAGAVILSGALDTTIDVAGMEAAQNARFAQIDELTR